MLIYGTSEVWVQVQMLPLYDTSLHTFIDLNGDYSIMMRLVSKYS